MSGTNSVPSLLKLLVILALLPGCSNVKTYSNTLSKNMHITTKLDSGSVMMSTNAEFDIHLINARCETDYRGRVYLNDGQSTEVGVPAGEQIWLDFIFASKQLLSSNINAVRYDTLLTPRAGYYYRTEVTYKSGIYNVVIQETSRDGRTMNTVKRRPLSSCKPAIAKKE